MKRLLAVLVVSGLAALLAAPSASAQSYATNANTHRWLHATFHEGNLSGEVSAWVYDWAWHSTPGFSLESESYSYVCAWLQKGTNSWYECDDSAAVRIDPLLNVASVEGTVGSITVSLTLVGTSPLSLGTDDWLWADPQSEYGPSTYASGGVYEDRPAEGSGSIVRGANRLEGAAEFAFLGSYTSAQAWADVAGY